MSSNECLFWGLAGTTFVLFLILLVGGNRKCRSRESIKFTNFTDPIFPDLQHYHDNIWPKTGGQIGENMLSGYPQYPKAY